MRMFALAAVALMALSVPSQAQDDTPGARTIRRSTAAGQEVRIFTYTQHRSDCTPAEPPVITLRTRPAHGSATIRSGSVVSGPPRFGSVDCSGKTLPGAGVWYLPEPGFHGADRFDYSVVNRSGTAIDTAVIEVR